MLFECRPTVFGVRPTLKQHWFIDMCWLCYCGNWVINSQLEVNENERTIQVLGVSRFIIRANILELYNLL